MVRIARRSTQQSRETHADHKEDEWKKRHMEYELKEAKNCSINENYGEYGYMPQEKVESARDESRISTERNGAKITEINEDEDEGKLGKAKAVTKEEVPESTVTSAATANGIMQGNSGLKYVKDIFPGIDESYLEQVWSRIEPGEHSVEELIDKLLQSNYKKASKVSKEDSEPVMKALASKFRSVVYSDIQKIAHYFNFSYTKSAHHIKKLLGSKAAYLKFARSSNFAHKLHNAPEKIEKVRIQNNPRKEKACKIAKVDLQKEIDDFQKFEEEEEKVERELKKLLEMPTAPAKQKGKSRKSTGNSCITCLDKIVIKKNEITCEAGHVACIQCVIFYIREAVYGTLKASMTGSINDGQSTSSHQNTANTLKDSFVECMSLSCSSRYLPSKLCSTLPKDLQQKLDEKLAEVDLMRAGLDDLHRCPHCQCPVIIPKDNKVLTCPTCDRETCKYCRTDWSIHFGFPCENFQSSEDKIRKTYEEKMTEEKVRICGGCMASIQRTEGCYNMTCSCGYKMCYDCRLPLNTCHQVNVHHTLRQKNGSCYGNFLVSAESIERHEDEKILKLQKEAQEARHFNGYKAFKPIGVVDALQKNNEQAASSNPLASTAKQLHTPAASQEAGDGSDDDDDDGITLSKLTSSAEASTTGMSSPTNLQHAENGQPTSELAPPTRSMAGPCAISKKRASALAQVRKSKRVKNMIQSSYSNGKGKNARGKMQGTAQKNLMGGNPVLICKKRSYQLPPSNSEDDTMKRNIGTGKTNKRKQTDGNEENPRKMKCILKAL